MSLRFLTGDDNGFVKAVRIPIGKESVPEGSVQPVTLSQPTGELSKRQSVDRLALQIVSSKKLLGVARNGGSLSVSELEGDKLEIVHEWEEPRMKATDSYIGLAITELNHVYSCTTSGHFRQTTLPSPSLSEASTSKALLPVRLCDLQISADERYLAYGGDEVDLSIWDVGNALSGTSSSTASGDEVVGKKRKKRTELFPAEVWRAKNLPNDSLSLRQPIHVASLVFIGGTSETSIPQHLITGSRYGSLRRYDTRAGGRPVANWTQFKSIRKVQKGCSEHEIFVSDTQSNLFSVDSRNGRIIRGYKSISGAVTGIAPVPVPISPSPESATSKRYLASVSLDRYIRLHTTKAPSSVKNTNQGPQKSEAEVRVYMKSTPTAIAWDEDLDVEDSDPSSADEGDDTEDEEKESLWEGMDLVEGVDRESDEDDEDANTRPAWKRRT